MTATLLVVEDDEDLRDVIGVTLERGDLRILEAENGQDALEQISTHGMPDIILLDMNMPVMNGWQFARELRDRGLWGAPVIVLTAAHDAERSANEIGAAGFLGKPFDGVALEQIVERYLTRARVAPPTPPAYG